MEYPNCDSLHCSRPPWSVTKASGFRAMEVNDADGTQIFGASFSMKTWATSEDARLVSAAPDLYESACDALQLLKDNWSNLRGPKLVICEALEMAIAKACVRPQTVKPSDVRSDGSKEVGT